MELSSVNDGSGSADLIRRASEGDEFALNQLFDREAAWLMDGKELVLTALEKRLFTSIKIEKITNKI